MHTYDLTVAPTTLYGEPLMRRPKPDAKVAPDGTVAIEDTVERRLYELAADALVANQKREMTGEQIVRNFNLARRLIAAGDAGEAIALQPGEVTTILRAAVTTTPPLAYAQLATALGENPEEKSADGKEA